MLKKIIFLLIRLYEYLYTAICLGRLTVAYLVLIVFNEQWSFHSKILLLAVMADVLLDLSGLAIQVKHDLKAVGPYYIRRDNLCKVDGWDDVIEMTLEGSKTAWDQSLRSICIFHNDSESDEPECIPLMYGKSLVSVPDSFINENNSDTLSWAIYHELGHIAALHTRLIGKLYLFSSILLIVLSSYLHPSFPVILVSVAILFLAILHSILCKSYMEIQANNEALKLAFFTEYNKYSPEQREQMASQASDEICLKLFRYYRNIYLLELKKHNGQIRRMQGYASMSNQLHFLGQCVLDDEKRALLAKENDAILTNLSNRTGEPDGFWSGDITTQKTIHIIASKDLKLDPKKRPFDPDLLNVKSFNIWTIISTVMLIVVLSLDSPSVWNTTNINHLWIWILVLAIIMIIIYTIFIILSSVVRQMTDDIGKCVDNV